MTPALDGRRFAADEVVWFFCEDREGLLTAAGSGGSVVAASAVGRRDGRDLALAWSSLTRSGQTAAGRIEGRVEVAGDRLRLPALGGAQPLDEVPGPRWVRARVAHPTSSIPDAIAFYGGLLELPYDGPHPATPYELVIFDLPGGAQLELTAGGPSPVPGTADDLLVLYVPTPADVAALRSRVLDAGHQLVPALNPYWERTGFTVPDPDARLVVIAHLPA